MTRARSAAARTGSAGRPRSRRASPPAGEASGTLELLGARIRLLRNARGLTLDTLARATGISVSMLSLVERGRTSASVGTLMALSSALSVSMSELFARATPHYGQELIRAEEQP